jgi:hypothetical protein
MTPGRTANAAKWAKLSKTDGDEGQDAMAQVLKSIPASGSRKLAPDKVRNAQSMFDTRAGMPLCDRQLKKRVDRNQRLADLIVKAARETGDSVAAVHAAHLRGAGKCIW